MVTHPSCCCQLCGLGTSPSRCDGDGLPLGSPPVSRLQASTGVTETWRETELLCGRQRPASESSLGTKAASGQSSYFSWAADGFIETCPTQAGPFMFHLRHTIGPLGRLQSTKLIAEIAHDVNLASSQLCSSCGPLTLRLVGTRAWDCVSTHHLG